MHCRRHTVGRLRQEALWKRLAVLGRSQNWLAGEAGISRGHLSMLVNGQRAASVRVQRRLLRALGVEDGDALFTFE